MNQTRSARNWMSVETARLCSTSKCNFELERTHGSDPPCSMKATALSQVLCEGRTPSICMLTTWSWVKCSMSPS
eukprot:13784412-Alexandrium_andersonii.AAC.1